jgi:hypothetical protein
VITKKKELMVESSLSFDNEISLPPSEETLYTVLEATPKMTNGLFSLQKPNGKFLTQLCFSPICFTFLHLIANNSFYTLQVT